MRSPRFDGRATIEAKCSPCDAAYWPASSARRAAGARQLGSGLLCRRPWPAANEGIFAPFTGKAIWPRTRARTDYLWVNR